MRLKLPPKVWTLEVTEEPSELRIDRGEMCYLEKMILGDCFGLSGLGG